MSWKTGRVWVKTSGAETDHAYLVRSGRARMLVTFSPAGFEEFFVEIGVAGDEPPVDAVMPSPEEFAPYSCEITGPPPTLDEG